jgi:FkbM family methyltransferase
MLFFDIGANIGKWSVSNVNSIDKIIAVEASPRAFSILRENIDMLPRSLSHNIILLNYAVSNEKEVDFYECKKHRYSTTNIDWVADKKSRFHGKEYTTMKCKTITLDKMIDLYGVPDLLKIDVEGGEYECLQTLSQKTPYICFEWAMEFLDLADKCLLYLYQLGYNYAFVQYEDMYQFRPRDCDYKPIEEMGDMLKLFPNRGRRNDWGMIWCK